MNLIGDHTDHDGGLALPFALPWRTTVSAMGRCDGVVTATSTFYDDVIEVPADGRRGEVRGWGAYVAGVVWALSRRGVAVPGARLTIDSDVPIGAGLSSSHALQISVASALLALAGRWPQPTDLAALVQEAENDYVGVPSGLLDQLAILAARPGFVVAVDAGAPPSARTQLVPCDLRATGLALMVVDTGVCRELGEGAYAELRGDIEAAAKTLGTTSLRGLADRVGTDAALAHLSATALDETVRRRARHVLTENRRVRAAVAACHAGRLSDIGPLLSASHVSMREDLRNSDPVVDLTVAAAEQAGALGARMTGGGFGGAVVALVERHRCDAVTRRIGEAYAGIGRAAPRCHVVEPSAGAQVH